MALHRSFRAFEGGLADQKYEREKTNDSIVHKVLDYISPKTQQRLNLLKEFLSTHVKAPKTFQSSKMIGKGHINGGRFTYIVLTFSVQAVRHTKYAGIYFLTLPLSTFFLRIEKQMQRDIPYFLQMLTSNVFPVRTPSQ